MDEMDERWESLEKVKNMLKQLLKRLLKGTLSLGWRVVLVVGLIAVVILLLTSGHAMIYCWVVIGLAMGTIVFTTAKKMNFFAKIAEIFWGMFVVYWLYFGMRFWLMLPLQVILQKMWHKELTNATVRTLPLKFLAIVLSFMAVSCAMQVVKKAKKEQ